MLFLARDYCLLKSNEAVVLLYFEAIFGKLLGLNSGLNLISLVSLIKLRWKFLLVYLLKSNNELSFF